MISLARAGPTRRTNRAGRCDAERHAEIDLRDPELRFRGREPEIAGECEPPAPADGVAVDRGDGDLLEALERGVHALEEPPELRLARRHRLAASRRHAALESASAPAEKTGARPSRSPGARRRLAQPRRRRGRDRSHRVAQRVAALGAVPASRCDVAVRSRRTCRSCAKGYLGSPHERSDRLAAHGEYVERAKITRLMRRLGGGTLDELQRRSWPTRSGTGAGSSRISASASAVRSARVLDATRGPAWRAGFPTGPAELRRPTASIATSTPARRQACHHLEGDDGTSRTLTYAELTAEVNRLANALRRSGSARRSRRHLPAVVARGRHRHPAVVRIARSTRRASRASAPRPSPRAFRFEAGC